MVNITHKNSTLKVSSCSGSLKVSKQETITAILEKNIPKGDVFEMSKAAGLLGVKKTPKLLSDCHPMPIEYTGINYEIKRMEVQIISNYKNCIQNRRRSIHNARH